MTNVLDRFLRYVQYDTRSDDASTSVPSTPGQLVFQRDLVAELRAIGLIDADVDANGYVMATIPATTKRPSVPAIGFMCSDHRHPGSHVPAIAEWSPILTTCTSPFPDIERRSSGCCAFLISRPAMSPP
jgi:hypothetical protein